MASGSRAPSVPAGERRPEEGLNGSAAAGQQMEMEDVAKDKPTLPVEKDIMQLARLGEIAAIQKLFNSGEFDATYRDDEGITPLHWAAINGHFALCHFLIQSGAPINAKGGEAVATPVLWAAKRCHYYVVNLLLQNGADPLVTDDQGFNLLHSATLDGNVFQLVLLLHEDLPIDIADTQGHTSLMWAAYKGYPACVDLFLKWGANVHAKDEQGFTALHWALVKGSTACIQRLIEYGADRYVANNDGKTPSTTAKEMNSTRQWHRALSEAGFNSDGTPREFPLSFITSDKRKLISRFFFLWPFVIIPCVLYILSYMVVYAAVPIAALVAYGMQYAATKILIYAPSDMKHVHRTPFLAGIFAGTLFWVGVRYITHIFPVTFRQNVLLSALFVTCYALCTYFYFTTMLEDPGYVPKPSSRSQQKSIIEELLEASKFDENHFCTECMARKPLRSKHCRRCKRCVAKHDHHCPWVDNCVAVNNHRHFLLYLIFMVVGIISLDRLTYLYLNLLSSPSSATECNILNRYFCDILLKDPFTILLSIWASLQLIWVSMLLFVHFFQIARAETTYESMKSRTSYHDDYTAPAVPITTALTAGTTDPEEAGLTSSGAGPNPVASSNIPHKHGPKQKESCFSQWSKLLGLDTFFTIAFNGYHGSQTHAHAAAQRRGNPFSRGILKNCLDFWNDAGPVMGRKENGEAKLGGERVNYARLFDVPMGVGRRRAGGYEAVGGDEV
ncbi:MAG: palmitoyltransferase akr1 [Bogoriella megaspora]|nr:MAG: palmitoyltransferase akr1 [Bogoriella megaspora]